MKKSSLSVVIPAYNEEVSLGYVLKDTLQDLPKHFKDFEIIVVDGGSTDATPQIADIYAKKSKQVKVIHQPNQGYNKAMIAGIKIAKKDYVAYMQADGQTLIRDMEKCFDVMKDYDLILGVRGNRLDYSLYRYILSYGCWALYRILFGITYEDVHWVYIWKTKEVQKLNLDQAAGLFLLVESLIKFKRMGLKIGEAPAPYRSRFGGDVKNTSLPVVWNTLTSIFRLWFQIILGTLS